MSKHHESQVGTFIRARKGSTRAIARIVSVRKVYLRVRLPLTAALTSVLFAQEPRAASLQSLSCDDAARLAAVRTSVPLEVLLAVTRNETGRKRNGRSEPWPWTVNMEGDGFWFDTEDQAQAFVFEHFKTGARSFDVGCFQINYKWHGAAFNSIEQMFDPAQNAIYAAQFLSSLYEETGDWLEAVGAYHSRTPEHAERYKRNYQTILTSLKPPAPVNNRVATAPQAQKVNTYPLLAPRAAKTFLGSLVPLTQERRASASLLSPEG